MSDVRLQDASGDEIAFEPNGTGGIYLDANPYGAEDPITYFVFRDAQEVVNAIAEVANLDVDKPRPDAVLASDVTYNEAVLRLALVHSRTVRFGYAKGDGSFIETRRFEPDAVREVDGHLTFTGWDPDRREVRAYRLDRIQGEVSL